MNIGYVRVSTDEQNPDLQIDALKKVGCDKIYKDHGYSGANTARPALNRALKRIKTDDVLVVWKLDRLGRSLGYLIKFMEDLHKRGAGFHSLTDGINTTTSTGKLVFHIMRALAEFERDLIRERTKASMMAAKARGKHVGRPFCLTQTQINEIISLSDHGKTHTAIANLYGVNRSTISRAIGQVSWFRCFRLIP